MVKVTLGAPAIKGAKVSAKVEEHVKGDKVIVFRKKRRKGYKKKERTSSELYSNYDYRILKVKKLLPI